MIEFNIRPIIKKSQMKLIANHKMWAQKCIEPEKLHEQREWINNNIYSVTN